MRFSTTTLRLTSPGRTSTGRISSPIGDEILPVLVRPGEVSRSVVVEKRISVAGDRLVDAQQQFDQQNGQPVVSFRFDSIGAKQFGDITKAYPPKTQRFA